MSLIGLWPNFAMPKIWQPKIGQKNCHRFGKPNVRVWQVLVANQILAKIMTCQIFGMANFGSEPIRPKLVATWFAALDWSHSWPLLLLLIRVRWDQKTSSIGNNSTHSCPTRSNERRSEFLVCALKCEQKETLSARKCVSTQQVGRVCSMELEIRLAST